jgi:hypothetical protein
VPPKAIQSSLLSKEARWGVGESRREGERCDQRKNIAADAAIPHTTILSKIGNPDVDAFLIALPTSEQ